MIETQFIHKDDLLTLTKTLRLNYSTVRTFAYLLENKTYFLSSLLSHFQKRNLKS
jgi:hypothetical protein